MGHVTGRFTWKSPFSYGNKQGNAIVKILGLVNSDVSVVPMFGKGITGRWTYRRASPASPSLSSETTSFMAASTRACTFTPGSERIIPETVESSVLSVSLKSNCCGAGR